jgi:hypothetical protein
LVRDPIVELLSPVTVDDELMGELISMELDNDTGKPSVPVLNGFWLLSDEAVLELLRAVLKALKLVAVSVCEPRDVEDDVGSIRSVVLVLVFPNSG